MLAFYCSLIIWCCFFAETQDINALSHHFLFVIVYFFLLNCDELNRQIYTEIQKCRICVVNTDVVFPVEVIYDSQPGANCMIYILASFVIKKKRCVNYFWVSSGTFFSIKAL